MYVSNTINSHICIGTLAYVCIYIYIYIYICIYTFLASDMKYQNTLQKKIVNNHRTCIYIDVQDELMLDKNHVR